MKKAAVFTRIKNGHEVFKLWYRYYSQFFADEDIYVLDFNSTDGSTDGLECNVVPYDGIWYPGGRSMIKSKDVVNHFKTQLLNKYRFVVYSDYDEIIYHPKGLDTYLDILNMECVSCTGYEIVQTPDEAEIDFNKPILSQRSSWFRWNMYDKPLITQVDFLWGAGFHTIDDRPNPPSDPALLLIHLHKMDQQLARDLNITNVVKLLIDKRRYTGEDSLSPIQLENRVQGYQAAAVIRNIQLAPSGDITPFLLIAQNKSILYHPYAKCCLCDARAIGCGHQNFFLGDQFDMWWDEPTIHLVEIPKKLKLSNKF